MEKLDSASGGSGCQYLHNSSIPCLPVISSSGSCVGGQFAGKSLDLMISFSDFRTSQQMYI
ncbi:hypothetical protein L211DRAFT_593365 [Terfezia boudieri ATCC MYA-4762]|uniref:Uncharacterized protein n=1 Tax=Terfezia boudieri ATCC MYA-4762 TaxID=1051890 RepID=A0A3N4L9W3_9PEZI|nr:hypothetical protein L211DRAFT_593365 [Terfezia boudieri ATCC MYA-4762]